jgi:hypothetical protein
VDAAFLGQTPIQGTRQSIIAVFIFVITGPLDTGSYFAFIVGQRTVIIRFTSPGTSVCIHRVRNVHDFYFHGIHILEVGFSNTHILGLCLNQVRLG